MLVVAVVFLLSNACRYAGAATSCGWDGSSFRETPDGKRFFEGDARPRSTR
jgi:hypothetical protein